MRRTDEIANNKRFSPYWHDGKPVLYEASFDISEGCGAPSHLGFLRHDGEWEVVLVQQLPSGSVWSSAMRTLEEVLTGKSSSPHLYGDDMVFNPVALKDFGLDVESFMDIVRRAHAELMCLGCAGEAALRRGVPRDLESIAPHTCTGGRS